MNWKSIICIAFIFVFSTFAFVACKEDPLEYQNQFLNAFGIDFITTQSKPIETDKLKNYIYIELDESERSKMEEYILSSGLFYNISEDSKCYMFLNQTLENDFSGEIKNVKSGYFSIYSKISDQIIDVPYNDLKKIDMDYFIALIYDSENSIIYLFDYDVS